MATKAQAFRARQQREAHPARAKQPRRKRRDKSIDTSLPGVSATDRKALRGRGRVTLASHPGGAALEASAAVKPSRKSTRKSADRTKRTTNQQLRAVRALNAPSARGARGRASRASRAR